VAFLGDLEKQGKAQGAAVEVLSVTDQDATKRRISLSLKITGSFDAVVRTLGTIEYGPYDAVLTNVTLDSVAAKENAPAVWTAAVVISFGTVPNIAAVKK
jgi:hypothetical protein